MRNFLYILLVILLIVGFGYWFWSFGIVPYEQQRYAQLSIQQSGVQIKKTGSEQWESATNGMRVEQGWAIKTDANGLATVRFFDQGESRIDRNSEIVLSEAMAGTASGEGMKVSVLLNAGRVWSRVLRLMDIGSSYSIRSSDVVATVRGTSFDVEKSESGNVEVSVSESAVTISVVTDTATDAKAVGEGTVATFASSGSPLEEREVSDQERSEGWRVSNELSDQAFVKDMVKQRISELQSLGGARADSPLSGIVSLSEKLHLALASDETKSVLQEQYLARRLYGVIELAQDGKTGLASQELTRIENDIEAQLQAKAKGVDADLFRTSVYRISLLVDDANPNEALYPFKQRVERLFESLSSDSEVSMYYARMVAFDARLDEASRLISAKLFNDAKTALDGVKSGVENIRRDSASLVTTLSDEYRAAFKGKLAAINIRQERLRQLLEAAEHPLTQPATSTTEIVGDHVVTPDEEIVSLRLSASSNAIEIGEASNLSVKVVLKDGSEKDVTAFSSFVSMQYAGKLNGPLYRATSIGSDEIVARYERAGKVFEAKTTIRTSGEVKLVDLVITSSAGSHFKTGQTTYLTATARYNNGQTKNVTDATVFAVVSGKGILEGTSFYSDLSGESTIAGTYRDGETTSIGSVVMMVEKP